MGFRVEGDPDGLGNVNLLIDVQVANPVGMAQDRDAGVVLDKAHQRIGAAGNDQIHQAVELEQRQAFLAGRQQLQGLGRHRRGCQARPQGGEDGGAAAVGLTASLENGAIAGADRQGSDLHHRIGPGLKNHPENTQGDTQPLQDQAGVQLPMHLANTDRVRQLGHLAHPLDRPSQLLGIQLQAGHQRRR